jgi:hypothetical protein
VGIHLAQASRSDYKLSIAVKISSAIETLDVLGYSPGSFNAVMPAKMPDMASLPAAAKQAPATPLAIGARGTGPTQPSNADTRQRWRSLNNNQIYTFRLDGSHFYIMQSNGLVVADLAQSKNGKKFTGSSILSTCPGSGYMEIDSIAEDRVDGRLEQKPNVSNGVCGGLFGALRQTIAIAFIREP